MNEQKKKKKKKREKSKIKKKNYLCNLGSQEELIRSRRGVLNIKRKRRKV